MSELHTSLMLKSDGGQYKINIKRRLRGEYQMVRIMSIDD